METLATWKGVDEIKKNLTKYSEQVKYSGNQYSSNPTRYRNVNGEWLGAVFLPDIETSIGTKTVLLESELRQDSGSGCWFQAPIVATVFDDKHISSMRQKVGRIYRITKLPI